jgi:hypothetical protein
MFGKKVKTYRDLPAPKPGEIHFYPSDDRLTENPPYINNAKTIPSWFRKIPKSLGSIRSCTGTLDYLQVGATIPLWTNTKFTPNFSNPWVWEVEMDNMPYAHAFGNEPFRYESTGECPMTSKREIKNGSYPKLVNPWYVRTAPGWSCLVIPMFFEPSTKYQIVPSIVHTDFYHSLNVVLNIYTDQSFEIKAGTPMVQLIPFKRNSDFEKMSIGDAVHHKLLSTRGFNDFGLFPSTGGTGKAYKKYQRTVDQKLEK